MKRLAAVAEGLGYENVSTYINSGNLLFDARGAKGAVRLAVEKALRKEFGFSIPTLIKTQREMRAIAKAIPPGWQNDAKQRTDVAYLFADADKKAIVDELPLARDYVDVRYVKGALVWHIDRKDYAKSRLNKLIGHPTYQSMTVRNVNTARRLAAG